MYVFFHIWYFSVNRLVQVVVEIMSGVFPELKEHATKIREIIADEEASFGRTLTKVRGGYFHPFVFLLPFDQYGWVMYAFVYAS